MKTLIIFDHPYFNNSRVNKHLLSQITDKQDVTVRSLSSIYLENGNLKPIDATKEQALLMEHDRIIFQFPYFWYSVPSTLKRWLDETLLYNFAYGPEGDKIKGKEVMFVITTGGADKDYSSTGYNKYPVETFITPLIQAMNLCGLKVIKPFFITGSANNLDDNQLNAKGIEYKHYITKPTSDYIN